MRSTATKLIRYFFTAGAAAVVDAGGFAVLLGALHLPVAPAAVLSFCVATLVNYMLSSRFVFASAVTARAYATFFLAAVVGMGVNVGTTTMIISYVGLQPVLAKIAAIGAAFLLNFWLNNRVVFRDAPVPSGGRLGD